jgi:hypothetical protein
MARADLHYALALDAEIYQASQVDPSLLDPVVRAAGGIPGPARPVTVVRDYQGPQGQYAEQFVLTDLRGTEVFRSPVRRLALRGEMFEDRFVTTLRDVYLQDGDEHRLTFLVDDDEVGTIPVFIESGLGGDPRVAAEETFKKALQKGAIIWLTVPSTEPPGRRGKSAARDHDQPVWFVYDGGKVYVFTGPTEQQVPGLADAEQVVITARSKDDRSAVSRVPATVRVIPPDDELFTRIGRAGLGRRLNLPDGDGALERWRANCALVELSPRFREAETAA